MAKVIKNIGFLTLSQAANYVFPLITIPYITRVVGPENYGLIEFATVAMLYFSAVVIYGFNTTATRKIADNPEDQESVSMVFSTVVYARLALFFACLVIFLFSLLIVPKLEEQSLPLIFAFPIVLGWALYPDFLFQGLQKLQFVALANFLIKALAAMLIFVLLNNPEDFYLVLGINSAAQILVGGGLLLLSFKLIPGLRLMPFDLAKIKNQLKDGGYVFLSHFFTRVYTFGSIIFLGFLLSDAELGLFAASLKLITVAQSFLFLPLFGALFPYLANLFRTDKQAYFLQYKRALLAMVGITGFSALVLLLFPEPFVLLVFGESYLESVPYLQIMAPILVLTALSHFSMQQGLIILKKDKVYLFIIVAVGVASLTLNLIFINTFGLYGAAWVKLGIDGALALLGWLYFKRELARL
jgi:PST family polysaccharide transporter